MGTWKDTVSEDTPINGIFSSLFCYFNFFFLINFSDDTRTFHPCTALVISFIGWKTEARSLFLALGKSHP